MDKACFLMLNRPPSCNKKAPSLQRKKYKTTEPSKAKSKSLNVINLMGLMLMFLEILLLI